MDIYIIALALIAEEVELLLFQTLKNWLLNYQQSESQSFNYSFMFTLSKFYTLNIIDSHEYYRRSMSYPMQNRGKCYLSCKNCY